MRKMTRRGLCLLLVLLMLLPAQAAFADRYTEYQTEHFTLAIPTDWETYENESMTYIVPPENDAYDGVYLRVFEFAVPEGIDETDATSLVQNLYGAAVAQLGTVVYANLIPVGVDEDPACIFLVTADVTSEETGETAEGIYEAGVLYAKNGSVLVVIAQDYFYNDEMYTYMLAYEYIMARIWCTEDGKPQNALMSYEDFQAAEEGAAVTVEAIVRSVGEWSESGVAFTAEDEDGEYTVVLQECSEEDYASLVPHMKLLIGGEKGTDQIVNAWYDEIPSPEAAQQES